MRAGLIIRYSRCRWWHFLVYCPGQNLDIVLRVRLNRLHQLQFLASIIFPLCNVSYTSDLGMDWLTYCDKVI